MIPLQSFDGASLQSLINDLQNSFIIGDDTEWLLLSPLMHSVSHKQRLVKIPTSK